MSSYSKCGIWDDSHQGFNDILCDCVTGTVILDSDVNGRCLLSEITVMRPLQVVDNSVYEKACNAYDCDGVILTQDYIIKLYTDSMTAAYCRYGSSSVVKHSVHFNIDEEIENVEYEY